jgi:hypothetical protein
LFYTDRDYVTGIVAGEDYSELPEVVKMDQAIQQANEKLAFVSQDKEA